MQNLDPFSSVDRTLVFAFTLFTLALVIFFVAGAWIYSLRTEKENDKTEENETIDPPLNDQSENKS